MSKFRSCKTRFLSVRYSKDLTTRRVSVAEVIGFNSLVSVSAMDARRNGLFKLEVALCTQQRGNMETSVRSDPRSLTSVDEILSCLSSLQAEEVELARSLNTLLATREPIIISLERLEALIPRIDELDIEASNLSVKVTKTAETAERVGGKVQSLDEEMKRVREASERISQVLELKVSQGRMLFVYECQLIFSSSPPCLLCKKLCLVKIGNQLLAIVLEPCLYLWTLSPAPLPRPRLSVYGILFCGWLS